MLDEQYQIIHRHRATELERAAAHHRALAPVRRRHRRTRIAARRAWWLERGATIFAACSGWAGRLATQFHDRAVTRRAQGS
ncbi:hypothetical protein EF847_00390 [Actinobacteria bacterium YIM 96077]|uniref:Uncharacterized protein n=1 Tax=Phytoactinopolyspora halophila TaxID=1981511 RepID=A0A329R3N3_9ACTN|nr:hypothetical protein [Phytoactinopolyspora halophila]AYY11406.1 hypothetical protein EF847_00390 [Actinobacteria bacterium YIM 96077]RAW18112.1 hypothetical protein DPM12_04615 [Phytoactinopolyspora halophila]